MKDICKLSGCNNPKLPKENVCKECLESYELLEDWAKKNLNNRTSCKRSTSK